MAAIAGFGGSVALTSGAAVALSNEVLTNAGDNQTFNIASGVFATRRYWDRTATFVVQTAPDTGTPVWSTVTSGFTIRYVTGQVFFSSPVAGAAPGCRISSGAYLPFSAFAMMKSWEASPSVDLADVTVFGDRWKDYQPTLIGVEMKLSQFYVDNTLFAVIASGTSNLFVVSGMTGRNSTERYEGFARLKGDGIKTAVDTVIEEDLDLSIDGQFYYFSGQYS